ncbi:MAG: dockerin type I domain-containing protein [Fimbriimonadales bacterium]|nr:dockerin type I domain-containing protein [Fimbriimonadales bacterium]
MRTFIQIGLCWLTRGARFLSCATAVMLFLCAGMQTCGLAQGRPEVLLEIAGVSGDPKGVVFLPDGEHLISICRSVKLWRIDRSRNELRLVRTIRAYPRDAFPSPNGLYWVEITETNGSGRAVLWHTLSNSAVFQALLPFVPQTATMSRDGQYLAVSGFGRTLVWRWSENQLLYDLNSGCAAFSNDGQFLYLLGNGLSRIRLSDGSRQTIRQGAINAIKAVLSPQDNYIACVRGDGVALLRTEDGSEVFVQRLDRAYEIRNLAFSADGRLLTVPLPGLGGVLGIGVPDGVWRLILRRSGDKSVAFSADGTLFATIGSGILSVWRTASNPGEWTRLARVTDLFQPRLAPNERLVAAWLVGPDDAEYRTQVFQFPEGQLVATVVGGIPAFSPDGRYLVTNTRRDTLIHRVSDWQQVHVLRDAYVRNVFFSSDGQNLGLLRFDDSASFYRVGSWINYLNTSFQTIPVGDGQQFVEVDTSDQGYVLRFRRIADGAILRTVLAPSLRSRPQAVSPDGSVVVGYARGAVPLRVLRLSDGTLYVRNYPGSLYVVEFTPDSKYLVVGGTFGLEFLRLSDFEPVLTYTPEALGAGVASVSFDALGRTMCYERDDGPIVVARNPFYRQGDVNGDGCVDDADLIAVLTAFGTQGTAPTRPEDLDRDGRVDDADLLTVLFEFGSGC